MDNAITNYESFKSVSGKTDQSAIHCSPVQFVHASLEWQPWFLHLRQKALGSNLKSTSVRFSRDIFQSPRRRRFGCLRRARFLHLSRLRRGWTFLRLFRGPQCPRDATIRHIIPNASLSFNRVRYHLSFKEGSLFPHGVIWRESPRMKMYLSSVIHLTSFVLSLFTILVGMILWEYNRAPGSNRFWFIIQ